MAVVKGTPAERRAAREANRQANRVQFVRDRAQRAGSAHQLVVVACNAALAASRRLMAGRDVDGLSPERRRMVNEARSALAKAIAEAVERFDAPESRKERP
jgi:hypothetical protein